MIHFAIPQASLEVGIGAYLRNRGTSLQAKVSPVVYEGIFGEAAAPSGTWIFAGICSLTPPGRTLASQLRTQLLDAGCRVLNDPLRSLRRFELLTALHDAGVNQFRAVRAADYRGGLRFPLFIRHDSHHDGSISPLLHSEADVRRELFSLRLRGESLDDMLIVELRDLSVNGVFRKYSAFRVGDRILCRHFQSSKHWMIKSDTGDRTPAAAAAETEYIESNPHEDLLAPLFEMAKIEYGRMDYGYRDGRVEVWEINTSPTLGRNPNQKERPGEDVYRAMMQPTLVAVHGRFCKAVEALDAGVPETPIPVEFDRAVLAEWRNESSRLRRRRSLLNGLRSIAQVPGIRVAWRSLESAGRRLLGR